MKIAYLGIPGSYSFVASNIYFPKKAMFIKNDSIPDLLEKVSKEICDFGVVPMENTTTGSISETFDHLLERDLSIIGEIILHIHHHLLACKSLNSIKEIKRCYSHPQAIAQCQKFFKKYKNIKHVFTSDTATAANFIAREKSKTTAAIAAKLAANLYDLKILEKNIEDNPHNYTRFAVIAKKESFTGNKISLIFSVEHKPGSLFHTLTPYARLGLNLTKIESRPVFGKPWEYIFFIDFEIDNKEKELRQVLEEMKEHVNFLKILGRYTKGKIYET